MKLKTLMSTGWLADWLTGWLKKKWKKNGMIFFFLPLNKKVVQCGRVRCRARGSWRVQCLARDDIHNLEIGVLVFFFLFFFFFFFLFFFPQQMKSINQSRKKGKRKKKKQKKFRFIAIRKKGRNKKKTGLKVLSTSSALSNSLSSAPGLQRGATAANPQFTAATHQRGW